MVAAVSDAAAPVFIPYRTTPERLRVLQQRKAAPIGARMPRVTKHPDVFLALSPAATATALGIRPDEVADAIDDGSLPVFVKGIKRRILTADIEQWVRSWPQIKPKKERPHG
jgi:hypothetical protein